MAWDSSQMVSALQTRSIDSFTDHPGLTEQLMAVQGLTPRPWRAASMREALGVPAILRAVTLISNTTGSLAMRAYRNGLPLPEPPRIVQRPNPFTTQREFYRDSAYYLATRGECVWWVAARDFDGVPASLLVVPLAELHIDNNERDRRFPIYRWGKTVSTAQSSAAPGGDFVHLTYIREPGQLRGVGPLQLCGAAVSVTVEAQEWAANFFAGGGIPSIELHSEVDLDENEAAALKAKWMETPSNVPRVTTPSLSLREFGVSMAQSQGTDTRYYQNGDAARMFGIPASLMEASTPGSSLTYQNVEQEYTKFLRTCLAPNYLEPIEQAMSDLLPRSTVSRFNVDALLRADVKTRYEVYKTGIESGVLAPEEARQMEGLSPGDIETAPVPPAFPQAIPASLPEQRSMELSRPEPDRFMAFMDTMREFATREQPAPNVTVHSAPVTVQPQAITFERGAFQVEAPDMEPVADAITELAERPPPNVMVDVAAPDMSRVAEAIDGLANRQPEITVNTPDVHVEPAQVTVNMPEPKRSRKRLERDEAGRIIGVIEE